MWRCRWMGKCRSMGSDSSELLARRTQADCNQVGVSVGDLGRIAQRLKPAILSGDLWHG